MLIQYNFLYYVFYVQLNFILSPTVLHVYICVTHEGENY